VLENDEHGSNFSPTSKRGPQPKYSLEILMTEFTGHPRVACENVYVSVDGRKKKKQCCLNPKYSPLIHAEQQH